jgi:hypothetical protein
MCLPQPDTPSGPDGGHTARRCRTGRRGRPAAWRGRRRVRWCGPAARRRRPTAHGTRGRRCPGPRRSRPPSPQQRDGGVGVAAADRPGEVGDGAVLLVAVPPVEHHDRAGDGNVRGRLVRRRPGPTMSASTVPASIDSSWNGSPTRTTVASSRTAASSLAAIGSDTIDISSTITRSWGRRLAALAEPAPPPRPPQQPVDGARRHGGQRRGDGVVPGGGAPLLERLAEAGGGLAGGGAQRHQRERVAVGGQRRQQRGDGVGLAGPGTAGDHGDVAGEGQRAASCWRVSVPKAAASRWSTPGGVGRRSAAQRVAMRPATSSS